jgi:hypothetical protein
MTSVTCGLVAGPLFLVDAAVCRRPLVEDHGCVQCGYWLPWVIKLTWDTYGPPNPEPDQGVPAMSVN